MAYTIPVWFYVLTTFFQEFRARCHVTQERVSSKIIWATAAAERFCARQIDGQLTREEQLLEELLSSNSAMQDSLRMYDQMVLRKSEQDDLEKKKIENKVGLPDRNLHPTSFMVILVFRCLR